MSTPTFIPTAAQFTTVRLYTELDPYYYTVDNRPLQDISANLAGSGAATDSGRIAALVNSLGGAAVFSGMFGTSKVMTGLRATASSVSTVTLSPGAMFVPGSISVSDSRQVLRLASSPLSTILSTPAPVTLGQEMTYLVQAQFTDFAGNAVVYPTYDVTNTYLPSTLLNGYLNINVIAGAAGPTGASVAPTPTPGFDVLYTVVNVSGALLPTITINAASPARANSTAVEEQWISPPLTNSWANLGGVFQTLQYKRSGAQLRIRGAITGGTAGMAAFVLPVGYRPNATSVFLASNGTATSVVVTIDSSGNVTPGVSSATHLGLIDVTLD